MTAALATLKKHLAKLVPPSSSEGEVTGLASGIEALDTALPAHGIPIGRLTELLGARGSGKTTFLRHLVQETLGQRLWVAYVDASRTLAPQDWAYLDEASAVRSPQSETGLWMIRPASPSKGAWCADVLLRSGAFALVVLDGAPLLSRSVAVRLTRLARSAGAALVVTGEESAAAIPGALRLRVERRKESQKLNCVPRTQHAAISPYPETMMILVEKGGIRRRIEVSYEVGLASRLCAHPEVPDRRGVAGKRGQKSGTSGQGGGRASAFTQTDGIANRESASGRADGVGDDLDDRRANPPPPPPPSHRQHTRARARRCAESDFGREERMGARNGSELTVRNTQHATPSTQSAIRSPQSAVRNPQSAVRSSQSATRAPAGVG